MRRAFIAAVGGKALLSGCGPTAAEQAAMDQGKCSGFGFAPGTDAYARSMSATPSIATAAGSREANASRTRQPRRS